MTQGQIFPMIETKSKREYRHIDAETSREAFQRALIQFFGAIAILATILAIIWRIIT